MFIKLGNKAIDIKSCELVYPFFVYFVYFEYLFKFGDEAVNTLVSVADGLVSDLGEVSAITHILCDIYIDLN